jgi:hypothetical protein
MTDQNTPPEEETNTFTRLWMLGVDGLYETMIVAASSPGYLVDAANHLPVVLNVLPGEQGFEPFSERPFLGSAQIYDTLSGAHNTYNDTMGVVVPEPATLTEHFAVGTGKAVGMGLSMLAAGPIIGAANSALVGGEAVVATNAATEVSSLTRAVTAVAENPVVSTGLDAAKYLGTKALGLTGRFAISNPLMTTALVSAADLKFNDGGIVKPAAKGAVNYVAEKFGLGTIFADASDPSTTQPGIANMYGFANDPAKTAGMLGVVFGVNALLNGYVGNLFGIIAGIAIALYFNQAIGDTANAALDKGKELLGAATPARRDPALPGPTAF